MDPGSCHPVSLELPKQKNTSGGSPGGVAYEGSAAGIGIAAAGIAAAAPTIVAASAAAAAPDNNQQNDDPTAVIAAKTVIAHMGDLLRVVNRLNRLRPILCTIPNKVPAYLIRRLVTSSPASRHIRLVKTS